MTVLVFFLSILLFNNTFISSHHHLSDVLDWKNDCFIWMWFHSWYPILKNWDVITIPYNLQYWYWIDSCFEEWDFSCCLEWVFILLYGFDRNGIANLLILNSQVYHWTLFLSFRFSSNWFHYDYLNWGWLLWSYVWESICSMNEIEWECEIERWNRDELNMWIDGLFEECLKLWIVIDWIDRMI